MGEKDSTKTQTFRLSLFTNRPRSKCVLVAQSCLTPCNPMHCSPPGSSIQGIFQARVLEWVAISFSKGSSQSRYQTWVSHIAGRLYRRSHRYEPLNPFPENPSSWQRHKRSWKWLVYSIIIYFEPWELIIFPYMWKSVSDASKQCYHSIPKCIHTWIEFFIAGSQIDMSSNSIILSIMSLNSQLNLYTSPAHSRLLKKFMMNEIKPFMQCHSEWRNWHHWQILTSPIVSSKMRSSRLIIGYFVRSFFLNCLFTSSLLIILVWNIQHYKEIYGTDFNLSFRPCISAYL